MGERAAVRRGSALAVPLVAALVSLVWAVGWAVAAFRNESAPDGALPGVLYAVGQVLAVVAAPSWVALCLWLARTPAQLLAGVIIGLVLLAPLPLLLGTS